MPIWRSELRKQATLVVLGDGMTTVSTTISGMIMARWLIQEQMGTYRQVLYLGQLAVVLAEFGLSATIYRFWNTLDGAGRKVYVKMLMLLALGAGLVATGTLAILAPHIARWYQNPALWKALLIASPYPVASIPLMFLRPVLLSDGSSLKATLLETLFSVTPVLGIVLPLGLGCSFNRALSIWIVVCLLRLISVPLLTRRYLVTRSSWWDNALLRSVWQYIWPIRLSRVPGLLTTYLHQVVMSIYLVPSAFAIYSMGAREIPFVGSVGPSISSVLIPRLVEDLEAKRHDQICGRWRRACLQTAMVTYPVAAFCILYALLVMQLMFSASYRESSVPFSIFSGITFIRIIEFSSLAKVFNRTRLILGGAICSSIMLVVSAFSLTWLFGVAGMASSVVLSFAAGATYLLLSYRRILQRPLRAFFPLLELVSLCVISLGSFASSRALVSMAFPISEGASGFALAWRLAVHFLAGVLLYAIILVIAKRLTQKLGHHNEA